MRAATPAMEGDLRPIGGPCRGAVAPALWGMGDLADVASIGVHRQDGALGMSYIVGSFKIYVAAKGDQTVGGSWASEAPRALVVLSSSPALSRLFTSTGGQEQQRTKPHEEAHHKPYTKGWFPY